MLSLSPVKDVNRTDFYPATIRNAGDVVTFVGPAPNGVPELWKSDGTPGGTVPVSLLPSSTSVTLGDSAVNDGELYVLNGADVDRYDLSTGGRTVLTSFGYVVGPQLVRTDQIVASGGEVVISGSDGATGVFAIRNDETAFHDAY